MGCGEGDLEKKAKSGFKFFDTAGWIIVASALAGVSLYVGYSSGVASGEKAGYEKGRKAGVVEGREAQLKSRNGFIQVYDPDSPYKSNGPLAFFSRTQPDGSHEDYVHRMFCSREGEFFMGEKIEITSPDGLHQIMYLDEGMELTLAPDGQVHQSEAYGNRGDGHIDTIIYYDTVGDCQHCRMSGFSRRQHYEGHKAEFDAADAKLQEIREYFAPAKDDLPFYYY